MTKVTWLPFYESLSKYNISDLITEILIQFLEELGIREPKNVEDLFQCIIDSDEMGFKENDELIQLIECFLKKKTIKYKWSFDLRKNFKREKKH